MSESPSPPTLERDADLPFPEARVVPPAARPPGRSPLFHGRSLSNGLVIALAVSGPAVLVEASWRGTPFYRTAQGQATLLAVAVAFAAGGFVAGRHRRRVSGALNQAWGMSALAVACLVVAAVFRLAVLRIGMPHPRTVGLDAAGAVGVTVAACLGSLAGRAQYLRSRQKRARRMG